MTKKDRKSCLDLEFDWFMILKTIFFYLNTVTFFLIWLRYHAIEANKNVFSIAWYRCKKLKFFSFYVNPDKITFSSRELSFTKQKSIVNTLKLQNPGKNTNIKVGQGQGPKKKYSFVIFFSFTLKSKLTFLFFQEKINTFL